MKYVNFPVALRDGIRGDRKHYCVMTVEPLPPLVGAFAIWRFSNGTNKVEALEVRAVNQVPSAAPPRADKVNNDAARRKCLVR